VAGEETLVTAELDHRRVREERQNFDPAGHYARPDVTELKVNRKRLSTVSFDDGDDTGNAGGGPAHGGCHCPAARPPEVGE
jgi:hypothetical protein